MLDLKLHGYDPKSLSPLALAFIGDGVFELLVRERLLERGSMPAGKLHRLAVDKVNARSQAVVYEALERALNEEERSILRRGRNASSAKTPKSCSPGQYRKATAIEALFGYLYLKGDIARVNALFRLIEEFIGREGADADAEKDCGI